ncbi:outer membrane protein [Sphingomonas piscis]|uniref:outer membrane protein n=1 Tax=Sphingomonas piscis TaxID=2714943 RepID=UPI001FE9843F|nr:porin family protein [Sphingomonas piscis]
MKTLLISAAVAATVLSAAPASAQSVPTGARIEGLVGYDRVKFPGDHAGGIFGGVGAGYDIGFGSSAFGVDVEGTLATTDQEYLGVNVKAGRDLYAGGRLSFALSPSTIGYVKAGYTNARVKVDGFGGDNLDGVRVGAGVQFLLTGSTYVGGEYRYSNYEADWSRHQLALVLGTRFGSAPVAVEAPVVAPAPEAPAPAATQTCADGSVILATDVCPQPPAPPAVAPSGERG